MLDFCSTENCEICDGIYDDEQMSTEIDEYLSENVRSWNWRELRDALNDIDTSSEFYRYDGALDFVSVDDDFCDYKDEVLDWMDEGGWWDEDDTAEEQPDEYEPENVDLFSVVDDEEEVEEEEESVADEDFSVGKLMEMCSVEYLEFQRANEPTDELVQYLNNMPKILR